MNLRQALPVSIISCGGALADAFGSPSPQTSGQDGLVTFVDRVADRLADEVVGDGVGVEVVLRAGPKRRRRSCRRERFLDVEMIAPTGEFDAVVAHFFDTGRSSAMGRSAHWPVKRVTGLGMVLVLGFEVELGVLG